MINDNLIETLSQAPVFAGCERSTLEELAGSAGHRLRRKEVGAHIAYMGDELTDAVILVEGTIYSSMTNQEGKAAIKREKSELKAEGVIERTLEGITLKISR